MSDPDLHDARSQNSATGPRRAMIPRNASIAVYVGRTTSSSPAGVSSSPRSRAVSRSGTTSIRSRRARRRRNEARARLPVAGAPRRVEAVEQRLEIDVPDPRDVASVGDRVVERDDGEAWGRAVEQRPHRLVRPGWVLDQEHQQAPVAGLDAFEAAEGGCEPRQARSDRLERRTDRSCDRRGCGRVVDVVEARQCEPNAVVPSGVASVKSVPSSPWSSISRAATSSGSRAAWPCGQR